MKIPVRQLRVAAFAVAGMLLLSSCGGGLQTSAGQVDKKTAESFITTTERSWHQAVDSGENQNLSKDARCYLSADSEGNSLGTIVCGPLRRLGTKDGEVWDVAPVEFLPNGKKAGLQLGEDGDGTGESMLRPANAVLWRPDGEKPADDADKLPAPPPPPAEAGYVSLEDEATTTDLKKADGKIITPAGTLTITGVGELATIGSGSEQMSPAKGERFVVARITTTDGFADPLEGHYYDFDNEAAKADTAVNLAVGTTSSPLEINFDATQSGTGTDNAPDEDFLIASVPEGEKEVSIVARTGAVEQLASVLTGERTSTDVAPDFYGEQNVVEVNKSLPRKEIKIGDYEDASYALTLNKANLSPWDTEQGWAPEGKTWLRLQVEGEFDGGYGPRYKWTGSVLSVTADGKAVKLTNAEDSPYNLGSKDVVMIAVPAGTKQVKVGVDAQMTYTHSYGKPKSGSLNFGQLSTDIAFS